MYKDLKVTSGEVAANNVKSAPDRLQGTATENKNIFDKLVELFVGKYNSLLDELDDNEIKAIDPITINGYTISHANSGVTQGMYGTDQEQDPQHGEKFIIPYFITDEHGHIVSAGNSEVQLPSGGGGGTSDYNDLSNKPSINQVTLQGNKTASDLGLAPTSHSHTKSEITDFPSLATVATTGDYDDLSDKPSIPSKTSDLTNDSGFITGYTETDPVFSASAASGITSSDISTWNGKSDFSGDYNDLTNKPTIPEGRNPTTTTPKMDGVAAVGTETTYARGDHRHPKDTSKANGNARIFYGTCTEAAGAIGKNVTCSAYDTLTAGDIVVVKFSNTNINVNDVSLNVNETGYKTIKQVVNGELAKPRYPSSIRGTCVFVYDGTYWILQGAEDDTTISVNVKTTSGTNIADLTINGTTTQLYAPTSGGGGGTITEVKTTAGTHQTIDVTSGTAQFAVPTDTNHLTNGAGFISTETDPVFSASAASGITSSDISTWNGKSDFSGDYDDLTNKPTIPTNTSDLNNDSGFIMGLVAEEVLLADNTTISGQTYGNGNKSVSKTGYTPIGIVGMHLQNASTGGQNNTTCALHSWYLSGTTVYWIVRGTTTATAKIKVTATVLYVKS